MEEAYLALAQVYDELMDNVDYDDWAAHLHGLLEDHGISEGLILDLGCGTGAMTQRLCDMG